MVRTVLAGAQIPLQAPEPATTTVAVPYPLGTATLQVAGLHLRVAPRHNQSPESNAAIARIHVVVEAVVAGQDDERRFVVAAATVPADATAAAAASERRPATSSTFVRMDLRVQLERVKLIITVRPAMAAKKRGRSQDESANTSSGATTSKWLVQATVSGTISPIA